MKPLLAASLIPSAGFHVGRWAVVMAYYYKNMLRRVVQSVSSVKKVGVVGSGQMGTGIAIVANRVAGLNVTLIDNEAALKKSQDFIQQWVNK